MRPGRQVGVALGVAALLTASGCSLVASDSSASGSITDDATLASSAPNVPRNPGQGCGEAARTDPDDLRPGRPLARCASGFPVAEPLSGGHQLTVALAGGPHEAHVATLLAFEHEEFAAENLTVELVEIDDVGEAHEALGAGEVDIVVGDLHAAFFDQAATGEGGRLVMGGSATSAAGWTHIGQAGLWVRAEAVENGRWQELQGEPVAVPHGIADISSGPVDRVLMQGDLSLNDMRVERARGREAAEMLVEGDVLAAWLEDPYWRDVAARGDGFWLAATPPQEPLDGVVMAERLLSGPERDVGVAFVRAQIRVINTWLDDNYRADSAVVDVILDATGWSADELHGSPALLFNWEIRDGHVDQLQEPLVRSGAVLYPQPLPAEDLVDRSLYEEAVGTQLSG